MQTTTIVRKSQTKRYIKYIVATNLLKQAKQIVIQNQIKDHIK